MVFTIGSFGTHATLQSNHRYLFPNYECILLDYRQLVTLYSTAHVLDIESAIEKH